MPNNRISEALTRLGWSQQALAEECRISPSFLSEIARGRKEGALSLWLSMSKALGVSVEYLAGEPDQPQPPPPELPRDPRLRKLFSDLRRCWENVDDDRRGWLVVELQRVLRALDSNGGPR